ncbi:MAG: FIST C-terminal domain-containing protein [Burkholderiales bacterium]|nr:FIST C-terminal domain-containing protein [Burkholderiales bacterium]
MHVDLITEHPREALPAALSAMAARPDVHLVMLLGCDADGHSPESADAALRACPKPIVGGVFPQLLHGADRLESGLVVAGLRRPARVATVSALSSVRSDELADTVEPTAEGGAPGDTVVAFADGLSSGLAGLVDGLFDVHGLGVHYVGGELVVRDPIARDGHRLVCVGEVPQGAFVRILQGRPQALVEAAAAARRDAQQALPPGAGVRCALVIDCISRVLFLGEGFSDELRAISRPGERTIGALTLGEIANRGRSCVEFHNKTAVVALLAD